MPIKPRRRPDNLGDDSSDPASGDEALARTWMAALKESDMLRHAEVHVDYVTKNGEILNDGTSLILSF